MSATAKPLADFRKLMQQKTGAVALRERIGAVAGNNISTKGKLFTLPDGTSNPGPMRVIVLDFATYNSYYEGAYNPSNIQPPVCFSIGRVVAELGPSASAKKPQHECCGTCPKNQWGSDGKGKACKNQMRLAVCAPDAKPDSPIMTITVSPTGLKRWNSYVANLTAKFGEEGHPAFHVTEVSFDPNQQYPTLVFKHAGENTNTATPELMDLAAPILDREPNS